MPHPPYKDNRREEQESPTRCKGRRDERQGVGCKCFEKHACGLLCAAGSPPFLPDVLRWGAGCRMVFLLMQCAVPPASCCQLQWPVCYILWCLQGHYIPPSCRCDIPRADPQHVPTGDSSRKFCSPRGRCASPTDIFESRSPVLGATCREICPKTTVLLCVFFPLDASLQ